MRIVQTFWTAGRDPLKHSFGWQRPEYNLMAWALSCLSLREHYDEVALYTDERGKHVLIDLLHLPYTEVNVVYDDSLCLPQHWAYAKVKTYSLQTKPFLHVDGDVFLPKPIPTDISAAPLVAQNREIGTAYYKKMMDKIFRESVLELPEYLERGMKEESIASYNMGVFGGNDMAFIRAYCEDALKAYSKNTTCTDGNCNLLFEQILFAYKARQERKAVGTLFQQTYKDNGYTARDFCLLREFEQRAYFHLLGGHKRNPKIAISIEETLLQYYPDHYKAVTSLFPDVYTRGLTKSKIRLFVMAADTPIEQYLDFLSSAEEDWSVLSWEELAAVDTRRAKGKVLSFLGKDMEGISITCNPYLKCFTVPASWGEDPIRTMRQRLSVASDAPVERVAVIPTLTSKRREEYVLHELEWRLLELVKGHPIQVSDVLETLTSGAEQKRFLWLNEIRNLLNEGLIIPKQ